MLSNEDLRLYHKGKLLDAYCKLGAHCALVDGKPGVSFATWAPSARSVSVVGDFNAWDGRSNPMERTGTGGVWQLFIPELGAGAQYKFEIHNRETGRLVIKTDPYARAFVQPSNTNAVVVPPTEYEWGDEGWLALRRNWRWQDEPVNFYEVHLGSWRRAPDGSYLGYERLAHELIAYAQELHYTHLELLPIFEHPLDESLGYQVTGYFAPTSRFGTSDQFRSFVDRCHQAGIGVVLDWVPLHFPKDQWALVEFDGGPLYERDDPNMAEHPQWRTLIFNYGRAEVRNFLLSNALYWLNEFHVDGLRVDAVSSMLYLDDARGGRKWKPNPLGGRENLPAVKFLREMNTVIRERMPDAMSIAEESSDWPQVSESQARGGLGFSMKWNMGWVNDTLRYMGLPWPERAQQHNLLTFERLYAKNERVVLAFSHDEVMAATGSLLERMYGDERQKFAGVRVLFTYQTTYPGKKLNFMGNEFGQRQGWDPKAPLRWKEAALAQHREISALIRDLGALYQRLPALHAGEHETASFRWLDPDDSQRSVISYMRSAGATFILVVLNFSPLPHDEYEVGVPRSGKYHIAFDSDAAVYGGDSATQLTCARSESKRCMGFDNSIRLRLSALTGVAIALS